jgi:hypothetical protein
MSAANAPSGDTSFSRVDPPPNRPLQSAMQENDDDVGTYQRNEERQPGMTMRGHLPLLASCALLAACFALPSAGRAVELSSASASANSASAMALGGHRARADFSGASADARRIAEWVARSGDNRNLPYMIVDKANARMFLFAASGALLGEAPVLLGLARGDDSPPGIGDRPLASIAPAERITPAGRFEAALGRNLAGQDILWVDYAAAISVHRATDVKPGLTTANRLARLASLTGADNRISHGCINVTDAVFEQMIEPAFSGTGGVVYVLPETRSIQEEFPAAA